MNILFISSGRNKGIPSSLIWDQGESIKDAGYSISYFPLKNQGIKGYVRTISKLKQYLHHNHVDLIHAHYGLSAIVATLAWKRPIIVSLMGSDVMEGGLQLFLIKILSRFFWNKTIVKSEELATIVGKNYTKTIPNGVNLSIFQPLGKSLAINKLGLDPGKIYILFPSDPARPEKNFTLAKKAIDELKTNNIELIFLKNINHDSVKYYLNASDLILLTSLREGSPNVIKEAMACNCPIVSTNVGDVKWIIGETEGCYITSFEPEDVAEKIKRALNFGKRTNGRNRIINIGLDSKSIANRIIEVYIDILDKK